MLEEMIFQSKEEKADFEKYRQLKGDDLYFQIFRILSEKTPKVKYVTVRAYIRYDKNLRDNKLVSHTAEVLFCHHIDEDKAIMLSNDEYAARNSFEYLNNNYHLLLRC